MSADKKILLLELDIHRRKLVGLLGDLLKKADELDLNTQKTTTPLTPDWHERLASTCRELAALSGTAANIEALVKAGSVEASQSALLRSTNIAQHLSERLNQLQREARL